jgi:hypothetical protein
MAHLIACLGSEKGTWNDLNRVIASGLFDRIYLIAGNDVHDYVKPHVKPGVSIEIVKLNLSNASEDLVPELYVILKKHFMQDKVQDLDMALNIVSGTGKEHAIAISTLMKLGYGIRLVDLDKDSNILEMM